MKKWKKQGLEPKLQLTPIAYTIRTLGKKIDSNRTMPEQIDTYVWVGIKDSELKYEPESYNASNPNELRTIGGKSKAQWIIENNGWLIDIVVMKQDLEADPEINGTNAQKTALYHEKLKKEGKRGLNYESYAVAQMRALKEKKRLEARYWTILPDSSIRTPDLVSGGFWSNGQFGLSIGFANFKNGYLRCRPSVRVKRGT